MDGNLVLFKDGRFHMAGISVCIPDGYYLDMDPVEPLSDVAFAMVAPDKTHRISIHVSYDDLPPGEQLIAMITEMESKMLSKPAPITLAGLHGSIAIYMTSRHIYAEAIFDLGDCKEYNALHLVFIFPQDYDTAGFTESDDYLQIAKSIQCGTNI